MEYTNIDEAITAIHELSKSVGKPLYYRGQSRDWNITSTMHRISDLQMRNQAISETYDFITWLQTLPCYKDHETVGYQTGHINKYWAIAQHYGYKTDLIDFTTDLDIARAFSQIGKIAGTRGSITCIWPKDVVLIQSFCEHCVADLLHSTVKDDLRALNYNPFLCYPINEISRIVNQQGVFLWDVQGAMSDMFRGENPFFSDFVETHTFSFVQNDEPISMETIRLLYPEPNRLETEIDRYQQILSRRFYYKNSKLDEIPSLNCDLSAYFRKYKWDDNILCFFEPLVNFHFPERSKQIQLRDMSLDDLQNCVNSLESCKALANDWLKSKEDGMQLLYCNNQSSIGRLYTELLNDILAETASLPLITYTHGGDTLGIVIYQALRLLASMLTHSIERNPERCSACIAKLEKYDTVLGHKGSYELDMILDDLRDIDTTSDIVADAWEREFIFVRITTNTDNSVITVLPKDLINNCSSDIKKAQLDILMMLYDAQLIPPTILDSDSEGRIFRKMISREELTWELMLNLVPDPRVCFSQKEIIQYFIYFILPWQFVMNPRRSRLLAISDIKSIRIIDAYNFKNKKISYWKGSYYCC